MDYLFNGNFSFIIISLFLLIYYLRDHLEASYLGFLLIYSNKLFMNTKQVLTAVMLL